MIDLSYQVIAISPDRPERLRHTREENDFHHLLLSDSQMIAAQAFGIAFKVSDKPPDYYEKLAKASGEKHYLLPVPSVFVINTAGQILFEYINPDHTIRLDPDVLLAVAKVALKQPKTI